MPLSLYDTMSRRKRPFAPADPRRVTLYVCGPTVYNFAHIGNFRPVVVFDLLFRLLRHHYGEAAVLYAANVTDVDDKINRKAAEEACRSPPSPTATSPPTTPTPRRWARLRPPSSRGSPRRWTPSSP
jgi:cysteinyl-tRNA synthetase